MSVFSVVFLFFSFYYYSHIFFCSETILMGLFINCKLCFLCMVRYNAAFLFIICNIVNFLCREMATTVGQSAG